MSETTKIFEHNTEPRARWRFKYCDTDDLTRMFDDPQFGIQEVYQTQILNINNHTSIKFFVFYLNR